MESFISGSLINDLEEALGQYILYREILRHKQESRILYLAIKRSAYKEIFEEPIGKLL